MAWDVIQLVVTLPGSILNHATIFHRTRKREDERKGVTMLKKGHRRPLPALYENTDGLFLHTYSLEQLDWLASHNLLDNKMLAAYQHEKEERAKAQHIRSSLEWKAQYFTLTPQEERELETSKARTTQTKTVHSPVPPEFIEKLFTLPTTEARHEQFPDSQLKPSSKPILTVMLMIAAGILLPTTTYVVTAFSCLFVVNILVKRFRVEKKPQTWPIGGRVVQLKNKFIHALQLLDESQLATRQQRVTFIRWAQRQIKEKLAALVEDPLTPIDDIDFETEVFRVVTQHMQDTIVLREKAEVLKEKRRLKEEKLALSPLPQRETPNQTETNQTQRQQEEKDAQRLQEQERKQREQQALQQQIQEHSKSIVKHFNLAEEYLATTTSMLAKKPLLIDGPPFNQLFNTLEKADEVCSQISTLLQYEYAEVVHIERLEGLKKEMKDNSSRTHLLKAAYNKYLAELEALKNIQPSTWPSWIASTVAQNFGLTQEEVEVYAFEEYLKAAHD